MDELQGNVTFLKDFRDCCVLAFTETWLTENDQDTDLSIGVMRNILPGSTKWA